MKPVRVVCETQHRKAPFGNKTNESKFMQIFNQGKLDA